MPRWDDPRGPRHKVDADRWERDRWEDNRRPAAPRSDEQRSFGSDERGREPLRHDRYAARYDHDRASYGRAYEEDAGSAGYIRSSGGAGEAETSPLHGGEPFAYAGQEYGLEGHPDLDDERSDPGWRLEPNSERRRNFDFDDPGVGQSQAGYSPAPQRHPDHDLDADYVRWRDERLRAHDREYQAWRREQHRQYDEQYRRFRRERQRDLNAPSPSNTGGAPPWAGRRS